MRLKKLCLFFLFLTSFLTPKIIAGNYSDCCCSPCDNWCSGWTVYADWLYWRTRRCELDYAVPFVEATSFTIGSVFEVEPRYDNGFRVGITKECGCFFFDAFYTYFRNKERDSVTDPAGNLAGTHLSDLGSIEQGTFAFASGDWRIKYDTLDILGGYNFCDCSCFQSYAFGGFKFARIDQKFDIIYSGSTDSDTPFAEDNITERIDMRAYGADVGFGAQYNIWNCFNLFGRFSYDVLLANLKRRFFYETRATLVPFTTVIDLRDHCWRMVSVLNLTFGVGYDYQFCNCCLSRLGIAVGYEFHQWINVPDFLEAINDGGTIVSFDRHLQSLGFDGLFIRVSLGF